jgi:hypothetical protein
MATYASVVSNEHYNETRYNEQPTSTDTHTKDAQRNPSDFVKPMFLKDQDVHGSVKTPRTQWLTNVEIYMAIGSKVPSECIKEIKRIRVMWRIYMDNEGDRLSLLVQGINLRGRQVPLHSQNPLKTLITHLGYNQI